MQDLPNSAPAAAEATAQTSRRCNCEECQRMATLDRLTATMTEEQKAFVMNLYEDLIHANMDRAHYEAILNGTWPSAKETLEQALKLAQAQPDALH